MSEEFDSMSEKLTLEVTQELARQPIFCQLFPKTYTKS